MKGPAERCRDGGAQRSGAETAVQRWWCPAERCRDGSAETAVPSGAVQRRRCPAERCRDGGRYINLPKSDVSGIGPPPGFDWDAGLQVEVDGFKYLGVFISPNKTLARIRNLEPVLARLQEDVRI
ncbi:hypothetical protein NDU88_001138 [Pleurodeles waltl]|uniref:Uncharacterized protein n=1 Tax=Pleurodeles waltl TaxID=8319 RepID=A0AAV7LC93_PLEWA|nr:hypothetical protein NDU88_001138 [Pleurodeles waltl]